MVSYVTRKLWPPRRIWLGLWPVLVLAGAAGANNEQALERLVAGDDLQRQGRTPAAWQEWQFAYTAADDKYLAIEALARMAAVAPAGSRERATVVGRLVTHFQVTPPRWLSDLGRKMVAEHLASRRADDVAGESPVRPISFAGMRTGLGFRGRRYLWLAHVGDIPPPIDELRIEGEAVQKDIDRLPEERLAVDDRRWSLVDPRHAVDGTSLAKRLEWRFDRCLVGYTFEPIVTLLNDLGNRVNLPIDPWYPTQPAVWQLRFRVFYPSRQLAGRDLAPLAENLLDTLLRAQRIGVEGLGRSAADGQRNPQILDVWLTPNASEEEARAGGERWLNNLYFYRCTLEREPVEWVREACHEYAHAMMPRLGRYPASQRYETWLEGVVGERYLMAWFDQVLAATPEAELPVWLRQLKGQRFFEAYRQHDWEPELQAFSRAGPASPERTGTNDAAAAWLIGFALWLFEAHEARLVHDLFQPLSPAAQITAESLLLSYQARLRDSRQQVLDARRPLRQVSDRAARPRPNGLELDETTEVEYLLWLPAGRWDVRLVSATSGAVTCAFDQGTPRLLETGGNSRTAPALSVETEENDWHRVRVRGFGAQPVVLASLHAARSR